MFYKLLVLGFYVAACTQTGSSQEYSYMSEKPNFFVPCSRLDPELSNCLKENLGAYITNYKYGIPEYPVAGKLEPVHLRKVKLKMNELKLEIRNVTMHGLGDANVTDIIIQPQNHSLLITLNVPLIRVEANYKVNGNLLFFQFNNKGSFWMETENNTFIFQTQLELHKIASNLTFASIIELKSHLYQVDKFRCSVENLFNGNQILETEVNELLNENWRDLMIMAQPTVESAINAIMSTRFKKVLNFIPADYFVNDISSLNVIEQTPNI